jgi:hypothetical protein
MRRMTLSVLVAALLPIWPGTVAATATEPDALKAAPATTATYKAFGQVENIRGSLIALVKEQRLIVLRGDGGVPYNFKVTPATKIEIAGKNAGFEDLDSMADANISVTFVPTRQGNVARKIQVGQQQPAMKAEKEK